MLTKQGLLPLPLVQDFEAVVFDSVMAYAEMNTLSNICQGGMQTIVCHIDAKQAHY